MDIGPCTRIHQAKLKNEWTAQFELAEKNKDQQKIAQLNQFRVDHERTVSNQTSPPRPRAPTSLGPALARTNATRTDRPTLLFQIFGYVDECDRKVRAAQRRLEKTPEENNRTTALVSRQPYAVHTGRISEAGRKSISRSQLD